MAVVEVRGLSKVFPNGVQAVKAVDLAVGDGELVAVVGPSGSGKSTLLRLIAGLEDATAGSIAIGGRDVTGVAPRERDVAMVFQNPALYPYLAVFDNLAFGLRARGATNEEISTRVNSVARMLGLEGVLKRRPQELSGGQRQRVALGRAIVRRPAAFLLDEPLSALDAPLRSSIRSELLSLHRRLGLTMIHVTHDQAEALAIGQRVAVMEQGRIVQAGAPHEVYRKPASRFVATFLGSPPINLIPCRLLDADGLLQVAFEGLDAPQALPDGATINLLKRWRGRQLELGLRPEHVAIARGDPNYQWLPGANVVALEFLGHETVVGLGVGPHTLRAVIPGSWNGRLGETVSIGLDLRRASWFDVETGAAIAHGSVADHPPPG